MNINSVNNNYFLLIIVTIICIMCSFVISQSVYYLFICLFILIFYLFVFFFRGHRQVSHLFSYTLCIVRILHWVILFVFSSEVKKMCLHSEMSSDQLFSNLFSRREGDYNYFLLSTEFAIFYLLLLTDMFLIFRIFSVI